VILAPVRWFGRQPARGCVLRGHHLRQPGDRL